MKTCKIDGCKKPIGSHPSLGLCEMHRARWRRYGSTDDSALKCLIWPFSRLMNGYPRVGAGKRAHVKMCEMAHGPAPSDKHEVAHSCGNGHLGCVHPQHVRWATTKENIADKRLHGTMLGRHRLTPDEVAEIRRTPRTREALERLASRLSVTIQPVIKAAYRYTFKDLP